MTALSDLGERETETTGAARDTVGLHTTGMVAVDGLHITGMVKVDERKTDTTGAVGLHTTGMVAVDQSDKTGAVRYTVGLHKTGMVAADERDTETSGAIRATVGLHTTGMVSVDGSHTTGMVAVDEMRTETAGAIRATVGLHTTGMVAVYGSHTTGMVAVDEMRTDTVGSIRDTVGLHTTGMVAVDGSHTTGMVSVNGRENIEPETVPTGADKWRPDELSPPLSKTPRHWTCMAAEAENPKDVATSRRRLAEEIMGKDAVEKVEIQGLVFPRWRENSHTEEGLLREYSSKFCLVSVGCDWKATGSPTL